MVFFGTSAFAVPSLEALASTHDVRAVVTQPDRPAGRGLHRQPSAVKVRAQKLGLEVRTPEKLDAAFIDALSLLNASVLACVSYGKILPGDLLERDGLTPLNVHPSLLPEYRGATPLQGALRDGRTMTGVTVIWMSTKMDAGDIALQRVTPIAGDDDYGALHDRLARVGAEMLDEALSLLSDDRLPRMPQDEQHATYTRPIGKDDVRIVPGGSAAAIVNLVRSASPSPGAWLIYDGKRLKVQAARAEPATADAVSVDGPSIPASDGLVRLLRVVPEGKRPMSGADFVRSTTPRP